MTGKMEDALKLENDNLAYKSGFRWKQIPCQDILWAYLRIQEVKSKVCCGNVAFDLCQLVVWTKDKKKIMINTPGREETLHFLELLKKENPSIDIKYSKEKEAKLFS